MFIMTMLCVVTGDYVLVCCYEVKPVSYDACVQGGTAEFLQLKFDIMS